MGGIWLMFLLDHNMSIAVGVGFIALASSAVLALVCIPAI